MKTKPNYLFSKSIFFVFAFMFVSLCGYADEVSVDDAKARAQEFINKTSMKKTFAKAKTQASTNLNLAYTAKENNVPTLYAFNINQNDGFIIVSADDATEPILGYADNGVFDYNNMPDNVRWWMDNISRQVRLQNQLQKEGLSSESLTTPYYSDWKPVAPLLSSAWGQNDPYNNMTPMVNDASHAPTGCVATAMAQIMNANRYPEHGYGSHSYTMKSFMSGKDTTLTAVYSQHVYNWDNMDYDYSYNYHSDPKGVAQLMLDCGIATEMQYGFGESGTFSESVAPALIKYFGYDNHTVHLSRDYFDAEHWNKIIYNELQQGRPVYYSGFSFLDGHAFVCDGYDENNFFHFDFGWSGQYNGFFQLSAVKANQDGYDAGYNHDQAIVLAYSSTPYSNYPYSALCSDYCLDSGSFARNQSVILSYSMCNAYNDERTIYPGVSLISENNDTTNIWSNKNEIDLSSFPKEGKYQILPVFKGNDGTVYSTDIEYRSFPIKCYTAECSNDSIKINYDGKTNNYSVEIQTVELADTIFQGGATAKVTLKNDGKIDISSTLSLCFENESDGSTAFSSSAELVINTGEIQTRGIQCILPEGKYKLRYAIIGNIKFEIPNNEVVSCCDTDIPSTYEQSGMTFTIKDSKNATLTKVKGIFSKNDDVVIPDYLNIGKYHIPVTYIADLAFDDDVNVKSIDIPSTVTDLGATSFYYIDNTTLKVHWQDPIDLESDTKCFWPYSCQYSNVTLDVPVGTAEKYKRAVGWRIFHNIAENGIIVANSVAFSAYFPNGGGTVTIDGERLGDINYIYKSVGDTVTWKFYPTYTNSVACISNTDYGSLIKDNILKYKIENDKNCEFCVTFGEKIDDVYYMATSPENAVVVHPINDNNIRYPNVIKIADKVNIGGKVYNVINIADNTRFTSDTIKVNWTKPFELNEKAFDSDIYLGIVLDVPEGCSELYAKAKGWKNFATITENGVVKRSMVSLSYNDYLHCLPPFFHLYTNNTPIASGQQCLVNKGSDITLQVKKDSNYSTYIYKDWDQAIFRGDYTYENMREHIQKDTLEFDNSKWSLEYLFVNGKNYIDENTDNMSAVIHNVQENMEIIPKIVYRDNNVCYNIEANNILHLTIYDDSGKFEHIDTIYGVEEYAKATWGRYVGNVVIPKSVKLGLNQLTTTKLEDYCFTPTWPQSFMYTDVENNYSVPMSIDIPSTVSVLGRNSVYLPELKTLIVHWDTPLDVTTDVFYNVNSVFADDGIFKKCTLVVPEGKINAYRQHPTWGLFERIVDTYPYYVDGDVNGDGLVDISDVNAIITVICGGTANSKADVNEDGTVDISDVNAVISIICGKQ